jgi:hypothetical protein
MKKYFCVLAFLFPFYIARAEPIQHETFLWIKANDSMKTCDKIFVSSGQKAGNIVIDFKLDESGKTINATFNDKQSTLKSERIAACIMRIFDGFTFPAEATGKEKIATATIPFPR